MPNSLTRSLRKLFRIKRTEGEMDREVRFHLEMETEENMRRGMSHEEAREVALRSFGGVERFKEECRDVKRNRPLETLWQDMRFGVRVLRRNPGFTLLTVLTLSLGIGANTAIFSVVYGVLLRPLPYQQGGQLVVLKQQAPLAIDANLNFSVKEIEDYRAQNQTLADLAEHHSMAFTLYGGREPERIQAAVVSANFFELMGVTPLLGRTFAPSDDVKDAEAVLILSHQYWRRSHKGDPNIVGKIFRMNDRPHTVIGVLPALPQYPNENDVYMPTSACPARSSERFISNRNARMMSVFARVKAGVSEAQAQTDLSAIAGRMKESYPEAYPANLGFGLALASLHKELTQRAQPTFLVLLLTAGLVLLLACANTANLTLARLMRRERELAVRAALGASRGRLIRQLLTESTLLALTGGVLGALLAAWSMKLLVRFAARFTPRAEEISLDNTVLLFTLAVSVATGLIFGLLPALSMRQNLVPSLKEGSGQSAASAGRQRLRSALVVAQVAASFVLLIGAGLMARSLFKLQEVNPGFDPERVVVMRVTANWTKYTRNQQFRELSLRLIERAQALPGALSAAMASTFPLNPLGLAADVANNVNFQIEGRPVNPNEPTPQVDFRIASPDYFKTIRLPLLKGRLFTEADDAEAQQVAVINQSLARHRWADEDPVGKRISFDQGGKWITIVGVVGDVRQYGLNREPTDELYRPLRQTSGSSNLLVRTAVSPAVMIQQMRQAVYAVDPENAIDQAQTLESARNESIASPRLTAVLLGLFASLALLITAAGIAGVMALTVSQRTHEIGIRMALGASAGRVLQLVLRQGLTLVLIGLALGMAGAFALTRLMSTLLFAVEPTDPLTWGAVALALAAVAALACFAPARRATLIDPLTALRSE
ncbi:MAG TPA: ABC transporter permease [Blastocatellia bacterium]|nr:ABC transporter permease [Blastocatellia bacterium]